MKSRTLIIALVVVVALGAVLSGCTTFKFSGAQVTAQLPAYTSVGTFDTKIWVNKFLGSSGGATLFNVTADAMDAPIYDAIQREIHKYSGDAAVDVTIEYSASFVDILLNVLTSSIYAPAEARITGTIVKYSK
jgi:hypothetical protein